MSHGPKNTNSCATFHHIARTYEGINVFMCTSCKKANMTTNFLQYRQFSVRSGAVAVGWGTALQAGCSRVRFPMVSLRFFIDIFIPAALWSWGRFSLYQKWVPGVFLEGKGGRFVRLKTLPHLCAECLWYKLEIPEKKTAAKRDNSNNNINNNTNILY